jgi:hypothetical protein
MGPREEGKVELDPAYRVPAGLMARTYPVRESGVDLDRTGAPS